MKSGRKRQRSSDEIINSSLAKKRLNALIAAVDSIESAASSSESEISSSNSSSRAESPSVEELTKSVDQWSIANCSKIWTNPTALKQDPSRKMGGSFKITPTLRP